MQAELENKVVPFDTGKVKIGVHYVRDNRPEMSAFEERLQEALLRSDETDLTQWANAHPFLAVAAILVAAMVIVALLEAF